MAFYQKILDFINKKKLSPAQFILGGFALAILAGAVILCLPICSADGSFTPFVDALFTATTSVCVTGLVTVSTAFHWSVFGQFVILILIQLGGMGIVAVMLMIMMILRKRIGMKNRILIQQSYGLDSMQGVVTLLKRIVRGILIVEFVGFLCYLPVLVPEFGPSGIWKALFLSVSAFCNAGMDLMGDNSLANYVGNYWMNIVTIALIVLGGLGFVVWWEIVDFIKKCIRKKDHFRNLPKRLSLHAKIVFSMTFFLLLLGMISVFICEYNNPETLGNLSLPQSLMASLFQSVTTRTAGFFTISQSKLGDASSMVCMLLMFIGGSPSGTAGGVKTVTIAVLLYAIIAEARGNEDMVAFHRTIPSDYVRKGLTIVGYSFGIWVFFTILLCGVEHQSFMRICYETVSAIGTVGLSKDLTGTLHVAGKLIIICMMYAGRIGPVTLATAFLMKDKPRDISHYADENILIG
ncbi:MAG: potassium transporter TrkG [Eubacteriales bacterium]|nr:potassium transporter TrkG [Eubacteriales bacterium]